MTIKSGKKLRIGCSTYTFGWRGIEWTEDAELQGQCDYMRRLIKVSVAAADPMMTLLHEAIHAIDREHTLGLQEQSVTVIADHVIAFCRDNNIDLREELECGNAR